MFADWKLKLLGNWYVLKRVLEVIIGSNYIYWKSNMFVREKKFKSTNKSYLQIVENYRIDGKVKQKVILSLVCLQTLRDSGKLKKLTKSLLKFCKEDFSEVEKDLSL